MDACTGLEGLTTSAKWFHQRDSYMKAARMNMRALLRKNGAWAYNRTDPQVLQANATWVKLARRCHAIAMGRIPIFSDFTIINNEWSQRGAIYVKRAA